MAITARSGQRWTQKDLDKARGQKSLNHMTIKQFKAATTPKTPKVLETNLQQDLMTQLAQIPYKGESVSEYVFAVPNGGYRAKRTAKVLKAEGVKRGVPDIHCFVAKAPYHGLYVEMKTEKGVLSPEQEKMIYRLRQEGYKVVVCRSTRSALDEILKYLGVSI